MKPQTTPQEARRTLSRASALIASALLLASVAACNQGSQGGRELHQASVGEALTQPFAAGSLVIPMDIASQDEGTLAAYGLVDKLLRAGVEVDQIILAGKAVGDNDLTGASGFDFSNPGSTFSNKSYSAAPFIVDASAAATASPIVTSWQAGHSQTRVDVLTASISGTVARRLTAAPRIAINVSGTEEIAFKYLNAAGIPDSTGAAWPSSKSNSYATPDVLTPAQIAGSNAGGTVDGALFNSDHSPAFCAFTSMHTDNEGTEAVREVRQFLTGQATAALLECASIKTFEDDPNGHFLTTAGIDKVGGPSSVTVLVPDSLFSQFSGPFKPTGGEIPAFDLSSGSAFRGSNYPLLQATGGSSMVLASGPIDGLATNGHMTWLGGHDYGESLPISKNPTTNGARVFLEALYLSPCTAGDGQPAVTVSLSTTTAMPTALSSVTYTISASNAGPGTARNTALQLLLPSGITLSSASNGGALSGSTVVWPAAPLGAGGTLSYTVTLGVAADGTYPLKPQATFLVGNSQRTQPGATVNLVRDGTPPHTTINSTPRAITNQTTAQFGFTANKPATFVCTLDSGAAAACTSGVTYSRLAEGQHKFTVQATDTAGNVETNPPSYSWVIDLTAPKTTITSGPPTVTNLSTATFTFTSNEPNSTFECQLDGGAWTACTTPNIYTGIPQGPHVFHVRATDPAGNTDPNPPEYDWTSDRTAPITTITSAPPSVTNATSARLAFISNEANSTFQCRLDGGALVSCTSPTSYTGLNAGLHVFQVYATDQAGNLDTTGATASWVIDLTPPITTILSGPRSPTNQTDAPFTFTANEPGSTFQCNLDGAGWLPCTTPTDYTNIGEGTHGFTVRATDPAGNTDPNPPSYTWTVDLTAPNTLITSAPPAMTNQTTATIAFTSTESGSTFECRLDLAAFAPCSDPVTLTGLAPGLHIFEVYAIDQAGNPDLTPASTSWTIDLTAPITQIDSGPSSPTNQAVATFAFHANEPATFQCKVDRGAWSACTSPTSLSAIPEGSHLFTVRATDLAGNVELVPPTYSWIVDLTPPNTLITGNPPPLTGDPTGTFTFTSTEPGSTFQCTIDGSAPVPCNSPTVYTNLPPGTHTFTVVATDPAGNPDPTPATYTWTIDTTKPVVTFTQTPPSPTNQVTGTFGFISSKPPNSTFTCSLDGAAATACSSPVDVGPLPEGQHTFTVTTTDAAGNVSPPATYTWTIDLTAPITTIDSGPALLTSHTTAVFAFHANEPATFVCTLDGSAPAACATGLSFQGLAPGSHTFTVRATDLAGNVEVAPPSYTWVIDTTKPQTIIDSGPHNPTNQTAATFTFHTVPAGASTVCKLDDGAFSACVSGQSYPGPLAEGPHKFYAQSTDSLGNQEPSPAEYDWTVDLTAPDTKIDSGPAPFTNQTTATFTFSSTEPNSTFQCSLDGAALADCSTPATYPGLTEGSHTFTVAATDAAGNTDPTPASATWVVDVTAPVTTIVGGPVGHVVNITYANFTVLSTEDGTFECKLDDQAWGACPSALAQPRAPHGRSAHDVIGSQTTANYLGLADGPHTFYARAIDLAGNLDPNPPHRDWIIDTTVPKTTLDPIPAVTSATSQTFHFSSNEPNSTFMCKLDGASFSSCAPPLTETGLTPGQHIFTVYAINAAGTPDPNPPSDTWLIDVTPPIVTIQSGPASPTNQTTATFTFSANKPNATFQCQVDAGPFAACTTPLTIGGIAEGSHAFHVTATDTVGNVSAPAEYDWIVDTTAPDTILNGAPPAITNETFANLSFTATESGCTFVCSVDGAAPSACASPTGLTHLADGAHSFSVAAIDAAGNIDPTPATAAWVVDTILPVTTFTEVPPANTTDTTATLAFTVNKPNTTSDCSFDGSMFVSCTSPVHLSGLPLGSHIFRSRATDQAGNVEAPPAATSWVIGEAGGGSGGGSGGGGGGDNTHALEGGGCTQAPVPTLLPIFGMLALLGLRRRRVARS